MLAFFAILLFLLFNEGARLGAVYLFFTLFPVLYVVFVAMNLN